MSEPAEQRHATGVVNEAAEAEKLKFLGMISHELKTPLNAIIGFSNLIEVEALGPLGDNGYKEFINIYPTADSSKLEELISSCRGPTNSRSKSSYRRLFKLIASCLEDKEE